jgi:hypothetical protein
MGEGSSSRILIGEPKSIVGSDILESNGVISSSQK